MKKIMTLVLILVVFLPSFALAEFNPNYIISDDEILDHDSMTFNDIREFLISKNSYLAHHTVTDKNGKRMSVADAIYNISRENKISPKFLLVLLQKEQSLVEDKSPSQSQLDWAAGYGCPDGGGCNARWKGLWKQLNSAALQFKWYMDGCQDNKDLTFNPYLNKCSFKPGSTYTFTNPYSTTKHKTSVVTISNKATAGLYIYTPHVYNGNFNFYKIWQRYFTRSYPNGTLVQAEGEVGVWLLQNGKKRPFLTKGALTSRYDLNKIVKIKKTELDKYPKGNPIRFPQYSLVRSPRGTIFLIVGTKKRGISSGEVFKNIGFNPEEIIDASWEDINSYENGLPITSTSTSITGALLQDSKTGGVYYASEGTKAPLVDAIFLKTKFARQSITPVSPKKLESYRTVEPYKYPDGELLTAYSHPAVYVIADGEKHAVASAEVFEGMGYKWENVIEVPKKITDMYPEGDTINLSFDEPEVSSSTEESAEDDTDQAVSEAKE